MENKRSAYSFFSWKKMVLTSLIFFVVIMIVEYLMDRKDYPNLDALFRENALRKAVLSIVFGFFITYSRARYVQKEHEANSER